jgi:hypothetical protein
LFEHEGTVSNLLLSLSKAYLYNMITLLVASLLFSLFFPTRFETRSMATLGRMPQKHTYTQIRKTTALQKGNRSNMRTCIKARGEKRIAGAANRFLLPDDHNGKYILYIMS